MNDELTPYEENEMLLNQIANPIRFKKLTLELEDGTQYVIPGLQLRNMEVVTPIVTEDHRGLPDPFIKTVGPQQVTITFDAYGIPWPSGTYTREKPLALPQPKKQLTDGGANKRHNK
jgi:hypothetical protein